MPLSSTSAENGSVTLEQVSTYDGAAPEIAMPSTTESGSDTSKQPSTHNDIAIDEGSHPDGDILHANHVPVYILSSSISDPEDEEEDEYPDDATIVAQVSNELDILLDAVPPIIPENQAINENGPLNIVLSQMIAALNADGVSFWINDDRSVTEHSPLSRGRCSCGKSSPKLKKCIRCAARICENCGECILKISIHKDEMRAKGLQRWESLCARRTIPVCDSGVRIPNRPIPHCQCTKFLMDNKHEEHCDIGHHCKACFQKVLEELAKCKTESIEIDGRIQREYIYCPDCPKQHGRSAEQKYACLLCYLVCLPFTLDSNTSSRSETSGWDPLKKYNDGECTWYYISPPSDKPESPPKQTRIEGVNITEERK